MVVIIMVSSHLASTVAIIILVVSLAHSQQEGKFTVVLDSRDPSLIVTTEFQ